MAICPLHEFSRWPGSQWLSRSSERRFSETSTVETGPRAGQTLPAHQEPTGVRCNAAVPGYGRRFRDGARTLSPQAPLLRRTSIPCLDAATANARSVIAAALARLRRTSAVRAPVDRAATWRLKSDPLNCGTSARPRSDPPRRRDQPARLSSLSVPALVLEGWPAMGQSHSAQA